MGFRFGKRPLELNPNSKSTKFGGKVPKLQSLKPDLAGFAGFVIVASWFPLSFKGSMTV